MKNAGESIPQWGQGVNGELMDTPLSGWARREASAMIDISYLKKSEVFK
jgi:hypothetical protein